MTLLGIDLRKPSFNELTAATIMAVGLWLAALGLLQAAGQELTRTDAGAALLVLLWACLGARLGIRIGAGMRHLAANVLVSGVLLLTYQGVCLLA
jgi:hypothetical protein